MEVTIGPYILSQRTQYSKISIKDIRTNEILKPKDVKDFDKIMDEYYKQTLYPEDYFEIDGTIIKGLKDTVSDSLEYVFIPDGITEIADFAFVDKNIKMISLPETLEKIGTSFGGCFKLEYINIPDKVVKIDVVAFDSCTSLKWVKLPANLNIINNNLFSYCDKLESIDIPDSVTVIENRAFSNCKNLKNVKLPKFLKKLNYRAFEECPSLENIILPDGLKFIGGGMFSNCTNLREIIIPDTVTEIEERAFINCVNLEHIKLSKNLKILSNELFANCLNLKNLVLPNNIHEICCDCFVGAKNIKEINIPKNLKVINNLFYGSSIETLIFNYNLDELNMQKVWNGTLIKWSNVKKIVIGKDCKVITFVEPNKWEKQISEIEYLGSKSEFETFKKNNKEVIGGFLEKIIIKDDLEKSSKTMEPLNLNHDNDLSI